LRDGRDSGERRLFANVDCVLDTLEAAAIGRERLASLRNLQAGNFRIAKRHKAGSRRS